MRLAIALIGSAGLVHASLAADIAPAVSTHAVPASTSTQAMCAPLSDEEMIIRANMGTLGDARFRPVDERTGQIETAHEKNSSLLFFRSWVAQPAGEWIFLFDACGEEVFVIANVEHAVCPQRQPKGLNELKSLIDAHQVRRGVSGFDWAQYDVSVQAGNCSDDVGVWPKSRVIHGESFYRVTPDGDVLPSGESTLNGMFRFVR